MRNGLFAALAGAAVLFGTTLSASAQDALERVEAAGVLRVGTETAFAPFDFIDAGTHTGLNIDIFEEIGRELGVGIEWITLDWAGVLPGLEAGRFDIVAGPATITRERIERYRFTPPIAESTVAILKSARDDSIATPEDIAGKVIGAGHASSQLAQLQAYSGTLPTPAEIREYPSNNEAYADLAAGRIAGVANALPNIAFVASQRPETFAVVLPPFGEQTYFGYPGRNDEDHASLMDAVDEALLKMKADGRLGALQEKWFGATFDTPDFITDPSI